MARRICSAGLRSAGGRSIVPARLDDLQRFLGDLDAWRTDAPRTGRLLGLGFRH